MTFEATRRKQVLVLQPRGKALYEDDSSFGSKMLAKMGWSKGNGLGKEQHGSLDFIQIRYKNNANGLGYDGLKDNQWTENESQFDNLLKSLNGKSESNSGSADEKPQKTENKSLEEKSKLSRARVHYKKFTRGKDVHKYSEKELANILGKKSLTEVVEEKSQIEEQIAEVDTEKPDVYDSNLIVNTGLTVTDYFKQKMQAKTQTKAGQQCEEVAKTSKRKRQVNSDEALEVPLAGEDEVELEPEPPKSSKKKRKLSNDGVQVVAADVLIESEIEPPAKKKKSKKDRKAVALEPVVEEIIDPQSVNKKKSKKRSDVKDDLASSDIIVEKVEDVKEVKEKSKKKLKKESQEKASVEVESPSKSKKSAAAGKPEHLSGANAVYSTNVIQIPSYVAQKMSCMTIDSFMNANAANIVGYGLSEDIELKTVQTKVGENGNSTDKYSLYNMDRLTTRQRVNPRKIISKLKRTKKSIQVI